MLLGRRTMSAIGRMSEGDPLMREMRRRKAARGELPSLRQRDPAAYARAQLLKLRNKRRQEPGN